MNSRLSRRRMMQAAGVAALAPPLAAPLATAAPAREWPIVEGPDTPKLCLGVQADEAAMRRVKQIGVDHVALGSDFDGALMPEELDGIAALPKLVETFRAAGWDEETVEKLTHRNWLRVLRETWR